MPRFFLSPGQCTGTTVVLDGRDSHHAVRVLRLGVGAGLEVLDGEGRCLDCEIVSIDSRSVTAAVKRLRQLPPPPRVSLAPSLLKGRAMDLLIQKATELGACSIHPLATERAVARVAADEVPGRIAAWRTTAIEACKQCGNPWLPHIKAPQALGAFLKQPSGALLLVASLREDAGWPRTVLAGRSFRPAEVVLVLGPEGDFTPREEEDLRAAGALPVTLGGLVLRAETAAIAGLAVLQHELAAAARGEGQAPVHR